jgi:hypothetical protein
MALTMGAAELSYRYVEQPLRQGALGAWWERWKSSTGMRRQFMVRRASLVVGGGATVVLLVAFGLAAAASSPDRERLALEAAGLPADVIAASAGEGADDAGTPERPAERAGAATTTVPTSTVAATAPTTTVAGAPAETVPAPAGVPGAVVQTPTNAVAVGDSVMLGARAEIEAAMPGIRVDAKVGRQFTDLRNVAQWYISEGYVPGPLIVHAGTNGTFTDEDLDRLFAAAGDRTVLLVNAKVARPWQELVNGRLAAAAGRYRNAVLVDWHGLASQHPEWFTNDGAHLRPPGAAALAELIRSKLPQ